MRIVLIGCSKTKKPYRRDASRGGRLTPAELYSGSLFVKRVQYAERSELPWMVLSAQFGLWRSNQELSPVMGTCSEVPYDVTMDDLSPADRAAWATSVAHKLVEELWEPFNRNETACPLDPGELTVEIHAGADYWHPLAEILRSVGVNVELPCEGLGIGEQLALYTSGVLAA